MAEKMEPSSRSIYTLKGGIAAYLNWMNEEIKAGRRTPSESLFKGRNYVFDGRGSTGLEHGVQVTPVSKCHTCRTPSDHLGKCRSTGCHLVLVVCEMCDNTCNVRCCQDCKELDIATGSAVKRPICRCELDREARLRKSAYGP